MEQPESILVENKNGEDLKHNSPRSKVNEQKKESNENKLR